MAVSMDPVSATELLLDSKPTNSTPAISITNPKAFLCAIGIGVAFFSAMKLLEMYGYITRSNFSIPIEHDDTDDSPSLSDREIVEIKSTALPEDQTEEKVIAIAEEITLPSEEPKEEVSYTLTAEDLYSDIN